VLTDVGQEFADDGTLPLQFLDEFVEFPARHNPEVISARHGTGVTSKLNGANMGLCTKAQVIVVRCVSGKMPEDNTFNYIPERSLLVPLVAILRDLTRHPERAPRAVVNLSLGLSKKGYDVVPQAYISTIRKSTCLCLWGELWSLPAGSDVSGNVPQATFCSFCA